LEDADAAPAVVMSTDSNLYAVPAGGPDCAETDPATTPTSNASVAAVSLLERKFMMSTFS
jgi:hypothetical protein